MDLGTVKRKLENNEYRSAEEFAEDARLVWTNCYLYNPPESDVIKMAEKLQVSPPKINLLEKFRVLAEFLFLNPF